MKMTVSQAMVECLKAENVKVVFGYPGAAICPFYDALLDAENDIRQVLVRQEANGGHAANGYARISGKPAVCIATSGPGATNLITAIATAYADSIPIVCITGQVNTDQIGSDVFRRLTLQARLSRSLSTAIFSKTLRTLREFSRKLSISQALADRVLCL